MIDLNSEYTENIRTLIKERLKERLIWRKKWLANKYVNRGVLCLPQNTKEVMRRKKEVDNYIRTLKNRRSRVDTESKPFAERMKRTKANPRVLDAYREFVRLGADGDTRH